MTRRDGWATAVAVATVAMAGWLSGCGLINGGFFGGGDQPVDLLNCSDPDEGDLLCACFDPVDDTEFCRTDVCLCVNGSLECPDTTSTCEVVNDNGCANAACACDGGSDADACACGELPGTCTGSRAAVRSFEAGVACEGDCTCRHALGDLPSCRCDGADCLIDAAGARCQTADDCATIGHARQVGCVVGPGPRGCGAGEVCITTQQGLSYCFVSGAGTCPPELSPFTFEDTPVCVATGGNTLECDGSVCREP